jgi:tungstate transport system permease protein
MSFLVDSFLSAIRLMASLDAALIEIVTVSLKVSFSSTGIACFFGIPAGFALSAYDFALKRSVITILNTMLALPTVVIGLFVYAFISRNSVFGTYDLLYTQQAIIIGQCILIIPIVTVFTLSAINRIDKRYRKTALTLGADQIQTAKIILTEARFGITAAVVAAIGRVISEIGISMMLGGNIRGFTRTMTTAMALEYDKGEFVLAVALGIILLSISLFVNIVLNYFQGKTPE